MIVPYPPRFVFFLFPPWSAGLAFYPPPVFGLILWPNISLGGCYTSHINGRRVDTNGFRQTVSWSEGVGEAYRAYVTVTYV